MAHDSAGGSGGGRMGMGYHHGGPQSSSDDLIRVLIDPFQDKRTAYVFYVNPLGARSEGLVYGGEPSLNWDGIWEAESRVLENGWSAELRIPFKTISFKPGLSVWGDQRRARHPPQAGDDPSLRDEPGQQLQQPDGGGRPHGNRRTSGREKGITFRPYGLASSASSPDAAGRAGPMTSTAGSISTRTSRPTSSGSSATTWISPRPRSTNAGST